MRSPLKKILALCVLVSVFGCVKEVSIAPCTPSEGKTVCEEVTVVIEALNGADAGAADSGPPVTRHAD